MKYSKERGTNEAWQAIVTGKQMNIWLKWILQRKLNIYKTYQLSQIYPFKQLSRSGASNIQSFVLGKRVRIVLIVQDVAII